jgi:tocopherol O-methyltransferase
VLGITISPVQTRLAQGRARSLGLGKQVQFATADANALDFAPESFDVIWNIECSEHLANKRKFFSDSARLLRRGGSLALSAWVRAGSDDHHELIARICAGMFCPSLGTLEQYRQWMKDGGLSAITTEDVTAQVAKTWDICQQIVERAHLRSILPLISPATNRFVGTFAAMRQAYREGALRYTIFTARKR